MITTRFAVLSTLVLGSILLLTSSALVDAPARSRASGSAALPIKWGPAEIDTTDPAAKRGPWELIKNDDASIVWIKLAVSNRGDRAVDFYVDAEGASDLTVEAGDNDEKMIAIPTGKVLRASFRTGTGSGKVTWRAARDI